MYRTEADNNNEKLPTGIPHIIGNEAAERFSFYGMKAILAVFLKVLNEMQGYCPDHPHIAHMERYLEGEDIPVEDLKKVKVLVSFKNLVTVVRSRMIIPRISLLEQGVALEDLARYEFTGSHRNCAKAMLSGRFEACAIQDTMA